MLIDKKQAAQIALSCMDLTTLNDNDTEQTVIDLCHKQKNAIGRTAAVCVYPRFVPIARKTLAELGFSQVKVATVTNFPAGNDDIAIAVAETRAAVAYGADEVDVVFPYRALMAGNEQIGYDLVKACKQACADKCLKVIIESGELQSETLIAKASEIAIKAGADFIKTSTGKVAVNATLEATKVMLETIKALGVAQRVGFKAAGGVRSTEEAHQYLQLTQQIMGQEWLNAQHFRFGASGLLDALLNTLGQSAVENQQNNTTSY